MPVPPNSQKSGNLDISSPCLTPPWSRGMGPGGRRPSHPSAKNQITPTSGLVNRQANHLLQNLVSLPQSCEGSSECNEATRLGLQCEGTPPQCNGSLFTRRLADPQSPKDGRQLTCPHLTSGGLALEGVTCWECGDALNLQYSFFDQASLKKLWGLGYPFYHPS